MFVQQLLQSLELCLLGSGGKLQTCRVSQPVASRKMQPRGTSDCVRLDAEGPEMNINITLIKVSSSIIPRHHNKKQTEVIDSPGRSLYLESTNTLKTIRGKTENDRGSDRTAAMEDRHSRRGPTQNRSSPTGCTSGKM